MEKRKSALLGVLQLHSESLRATLELLDEPAVAVSERVPWADVKKLAEQVSKEATTSGMLWSGTPTQQEASEKLQSYVNQLQGFILLCHGTTVGAGPTLLSLIQKNCKLVVESSLNLLQNALSINSQAARQETLPPLTGCVWEACELIQKQASDNKTAIGRAIVQAGISMKDVLRELNEIKPTDDDDYSSSCSEAELEAPELSFKFSASDMEIVEVSKRVIEGVVELARQVLYVVSKSEEKLSSLEKLLKLVQGLGRDVDELGASVFMQEVEKLGEFSRGLDAGVGLVSGEVCSMIGGRLPEGLASACERVHEFHLGLEDMLARLDVTESLEDLKLR